MRIGVNIYLLQPNVGGIANYVMTFLREWPELYPDHPLVLFAYEHNKPMLDECPASLQQHVKVLPHQEAILDHLDDMDVYFCPFGALYPRPIRKPSVVLVMDIQERFFPEFFDDEQWKARAFHYTWSLRMADRVMAISDFSKRTFVEVAVIPEEKIDRVYLCADELPEEAKQPEVALDLEQPFAFYPANSWAHKNHGRLLDAIALNREHGLKIQTVLTGAQVENTPSLHDAIKERSLEDLVEHAGRISRAELAWLYRNARMLVNPSLFEGFGIPLVEAMQSDCAITCSGTTSLPEVGGPAIRTFDPYSTASIAEVLHDVWTDETLRNELVIHGRQQCKMFTPAAAMKAQLGVFEKAIEDFSIVRYRQQDRFWRHASRLWNLMPRPSARKLAKTRELLKVQGR